MRLRRTQTGRGGGREINFTTVIGKVEAVYGPGRRRMNFLADGGTAPARVEGGKGKKRVSCHFTDREMKKYSAYFTVRSGPIKEKNFTKVLRGEVPADPGWVDPGWGTLLGEKGESPVYLSEGEKSPSR